MPNSILPVFSIITPSFNQAEFIAATIESVLAQRYSNLEYIVVDGGSMDGSVEIIKKYENEITRWVSEPDSGQSDAINKGIRSAKGEWICWINSDDMLAEGALQTVANTIQQNPDWRNMFMGRYLETDIDGNLIYEKGSDIRTLENLVDISGQWRKKGGNQIGQQGVFFSKRLFEKAGGLNVQNHYTMDYELWGKMLLVGGRIVPINEVLGIFRTYKGQKISDRYKTTKSLFNDAQNLILETHWRLGKKRKCLWKNRKYWWKYNYHHMRSKIGAKRRFKQVFGL